MAQGARGGLGPPLAAVWVCRPVAVWGRWPVAAFCFHDSTLVRLRDAATGLIVDASGTHTEFDG
ncbi:MAG TPA: hypothetical protein VE132_11770, partial [Micromonosporaceae bacterium]|nr:hypothetical protein [Micromonosporaceae bacterium]